MSRARCLTLATLAALATGCSGGGGSTASSPTVASGAVVGSLRLLVPAQTTAAKRKPAFVSPSVASVEVTVSGIAGTVIANVGAGSPDCTSGSGGVTCTVPIHAPLGNDTITVTLFAGAGATGTILGSGTSSVNVSGGGFSVAVTVNGSIGSISLTLANAYLPVVDGGTTAATVVAKDAGGNQIVGTYATPITLTAAAGLKLSAASVADSGHATISVTYDGISRTALNITAASGSANAFGAIIPTTHLHVYSAPAHLPGGASLFPIVLGPDGAVYFGDLGPNYINSNGFIVPTGPGAVGRVDPVTGVISELTLKGIGPAGLFFVGSDLYVAEETTGTIGRIVGAGAGGFSLTNYSQLVLPDAPPPGPWSPHYATPRRFAYAGGNLYVTSLEDKSVDAIPLAQWSSGTSAVTRIIEPGKGDHPDGISLGSDGNIYIANNSFLSSNVGKLVPGTTTVTETADPLTNGSAYEVLRFIALGTDGKLYVTATADPPNPDPVQRFDGSTFSALAPLSPLQQEPDGIHPGSGQTLVFADLYTGGIGMYDTTANVFREYPTIGVQSTSAVAPNDVADGLDDSYWYTAGNFGTGSITRPNAQIGRLVLAQGWQVLPEGTIQIDGLGPAGAALLGIAESSTSHDTVTVASATPGICSVSAPAQYVGTYVVEGLAVGACTVTATDQTGRVVSVPITVSGSTLSITSRRRSSHESAL